MAGTETAGVGTEGGAQVGKDTDDKGNDHEVTTELTTEVVSDMSGILQELRWSQQRRPHALAGQHGR